MINNLAAFKRALTMGSLWKATALRGGIWVDLGVRPVCIKQSNAVAFKTDTGASWHDFEKADVYRFNLNKVSVTNGEKGADMATILEYELINKGIH